MQEPLVITPRGFFLLSYMRKKTTNAAMSILFGAVFYSELVNKYNYPTI